MKLEHRNNVNVIRLIAAYGVLIAHTLPIKYGSSELPILGLFRSGYLGHYSVLAFFFLSGYLIVQSFQHAKSVTQFFEARALRIYPEHIASAVFCLLIIGPWVTTLPLQEYFMNPQILKFLKAVLLVGSDNLPGVFPEGHFGGAVNGSMWSLIHEIKLYIIIGIAGFLYILRPSSIRAVTLLVLFILIPIRYGQWSLDNLDEVRRDMCMLYAAFIVGGLFLHFRPRIPFFWPILIVFWGLFAASHSAYFFLAGFCYSLYYVAFNPALYLHRFNFKNDFSYGVYLFAWPIQQTIIHFYPQIETWAYFVIASSLTTVMASFSWFFVGKPALTLKKRTFMAKFDFERCRDRVWHPKS